MTNRSFCASPSSVWPCCQPLFQRFALPICRLPRRRPSHGLGLYSATSPALRSPRRESPTPRTFDLRRQGNFTRIALRYRGRLQLADAQFELGVGVRSRCNLIDSGRQQHVFRIFGLYIRQIVGSHILFRQFERPHSYAFGRSLIYAKAVRHAQGVDHGHERRKRRHFGNRCCRYLDPFEFDAVGGRWYRI